MGTLENSEWPNGQHMYKKIITRKRLFQTTSGTTTETTEGVGRKDTQDQREGLKEE